MHGRTLARMATIMAPVAVLGAAVTVRAAMPNIVVILTDDQGYADISLNPRHPKEVSTPHMDALARDGVVFTQAYTSGNVCSPTRAGLMLGRYQQRVGVYSGGDGGRGFDPRLPIFPAFLPEEYVCGAFGKWHLGLDKDFPKLKWHPLSRGFDEFYGFMGRGGHSYFDLRSDSTGKFKHPIYRNKERINDHGYLTNRLTEEAVAFIERHKDRPFFLYLAYNAVHAPAEAPQADIAEFRRRFPHLSEKRAILMAMLRHLDNGVGEVVTKLKHEGLYENTLLFFLTDNGGSKAMSAVNTPLRGFKGSFYEGGIRTPFIVSWPARFRGGRIIDTPVISLDILPTALEAAGVELPTDPPLDGRSLLPLIAGESTAHHEILFWTDGPAGEWAVRRGRWKLHGLKDSIELFDLVRDPSEQHDLATEHPDIVRQLTAAFDKWLEPMPSPITGGAKRWQHAGNDGSRRQPSSRKQSRAKGRNDDRDTQERTAPSGNAPADDRSVGRENSSAAADGANDHARPNVLFIVCDDLNTHVSTSGYPHIRTPAFDRLAASGMNFRRAYCQYPVCNPSRTSFLHGLYPQATRVLDNKADIRQTRPGTVSLPQRFKHSGYWTAAVGKVFHNPTLDPGRAAWHDVRRFENDELPIVTAAREKFEAQHGPIDRGKNRRLWRTILPTIGTQTRGQTRPGYGPSGLRDEQHRDGKNARQIATWLKQKPFGDKPFFMACGIHKPHVPFLAPDRYFAMYPKTSLVLTREPPNFWEQAPRSAMVRRYEGFGFRLGVENDALRREYMQAYHACISFIDAQIGLMLDALEQSGHAHDTIVVLTSDHGYQLGEHFMWGKVTLFEVCSRVPLLVRVPGVTRPGSASDELVELVDLYPTLCELCGVVAPAGLHGRSFVPLLRDPSAEGKTFAYTVVRRGPHLGKAVRSKRWRYAIWPDGEELYDLQNDPAEHHNLALRERYADVLEAMRSQLKKADSLATSHLKDIRSE